MLHLRVNVRGKTGIMRVKNSLLDLAHTCDNKACNASEVLSAICHYLTSRQVTAMKSAVRSACGRDHVDHIMVWLAGLDYNSPFKNVWRVFFDHLRTGEPLAASAARYEIGIKDITFIYQCLSERAVALLEHMALSTVNTMITKRLSSRNKNKIVSELDKHAKYLVGKKLRFITQYDPGLDVLDFHQELMLSGMTAVRHYEHMAEGAKHDILKITNFSRSSMSNHAFAIIKYHTTDDRARIQNVSAQQDRPCPQCDATILAGAQKCGECGAYPNNVGHHVHEYAITTLSLDRNALSASNSEDTQLHDVLTESDSCEHKVSQHKRLQYAEFFAELEDFPSKYRTYVEILSGVYPESFLEWLTVHYNQAPEAIKSHETFKDIVAQHLDIDSDIADSCFLKAIKRHFGHKLSKFEKPIKSL